MLRTSRWMALICGGYVLLCIPGIYLSEAGGIGVDESFFHVTQLLAVVMTGAAVVRYLVGHRQAAREEAGIELVAAAEAEPHWAPLLMKAAFVLMAGWLLFLAFVIISLMQMPSWD